MKKLSSLFGKQYTFLNINELSLTRDKIEVKPDVVYVDWEERRCDFKCPCGCGDWITLNLLNTAKQCWKITLNSISPSIHRTVGCKSHFFITNGMSSLNQVNQTIPKRFQK